MKQDENQRTKQKYEEGRKMKQDENGIWTFIRYISITVIVLIILFNSFYIIAAGQRGVILTWGNPNPTPATEGLHLKIPIAQIIIKMDIKTLKYEADASAASKDLQTVHTKIAVNYHLSADIVPKLYKEIGIDYQETIIQPAVQEVVKQATAKYTAEELITHRESVKEDIDVSLRDRLISRGITMETTSITNFEFSDEFNKAIESKVTAEQLALKATRDLERIKIEAEQKVAQASGESQAIEIINSQLLKSPQYISYMAVQKWNGILPLATGGVVPFIDLNVNSSMR